jgi:hypothetical protein
VFIHTVNCIFYRTVDLKSVSFSELALQVLQYTKSIIMSHIFNYSRTILMYIPLFFFVLSCNDRSKDEQAVWELEESYWRYAKDNDTVSYRNLWDDRFIGWPGLSEPPADKIHVSDWIAYLHENPDSVVWEYELKNKTVRSFGDVVVVQYYGRTFFRSKITMDTIKDEDFFRIWHTWQRKGKTWQIITGMSAGLPEN